jgi:hypothetical protein
MKRTLPILALLSAHALAVDSTVPTAFTAERYTKMIEQSPFALATPVVPVAAPQASFAANWYLTGVGRDEQGNDFIAITNQDRSVSFSLSGREVHPETGVSLASVSWDDGYKKTTAIIKKGTETAKLEFSQNDAVAAAPQMPGPRPGGPGAPIPQTPVVVRPAGGGLTPGATQPRINLPRPSGAPVSAPVTAPVVQPGQLPGTSPQPVGENRRRVRNIAAPQ